MPKKKATQEELPGMEARDVPEIEQAAEHYRQIRDERCALSKQEAEAKAALIQVMKNKGRSYYSYNGLNVQLSNQENVKVKSKDEDDEDYEPVGRFTQPKREPKINTSPATEFIEEIDAEEEGNLAAAALCACGHLAVDHEENGACKVAMVEGVEACDCDGFTPRVEDASEEDRERLHREAVARWNRERPASEEAEKEEDYQAEWFAGLTAEEREKYHNAPCTCPHARDWHGEEDEDICETRCGLCKCEQYHCPVCDTKGGHQAACEHYVLGEGTPLQDDFTAPRCDECKRTDGAHTKECSHSHDLRFSDYLAYAEAHYKKNRQSHARKMELTRLKDDEVRAWKQQQAAGDGVEAEPEPKKKSKKLSLVEAAIDR